MHTHKNQAENQSGKAGECDRRTNIAVQKDWKVRRKTRRVVKNGMVLALKLLAGH